MEADTKAAVYWQQRAYAAEVEANDLRIEVQRLQYTLEELTNQLALLSPPGNKKSKGMANA